MRRFNPAEFAWRFSSLFQAECHLMTVPAVVDSARTRQTLIDHCGLAEVFEEARGLDTVLLSVGDMTPGGTPYRYGVLDDTLRQRLAAKGAVGDLLFNYYDADGRLVDDPLQGCVMSVPLETLAAVPRRILASGGQGKIPAMWGAMQLLRPTTLITDEFVAAALLQRAAQKA